MLQRRGIFAAVLVALTLSPVVAHADARCTDRSTDAHELVLPPVDGHDVTGKFAFPSQSPKGLVVIFHGFRHTAADWAPLLDQLAEEDQVVTVAMNYHGEDKETHTWQVAEGADDSIAATNQLIQMCGGFDTVVAYGVSMGGNASGLAIAKAPGLFDWWFDIEGANNVIETYNEARALLPSGDKTVVAAVAGIENEMGGKFEDVPASYAAHTNVVLADQIAGSGIGGVVMVHAVDDGLVPHDQSREMQAALLARGKAVQFWTVFMKGRSNDTTIDGYVPVEHDRPLAGHASETNRDSRVEWVGLDRLRALFHDGATPRTSGEFVYNEAPANGAPEVYTQP